MGKLRTYILFIFIVFCSASEVHAQVKLTNNKIDISYGLCYSHFINNGYENVSSINNSFNNEYSAEFNKKFLFNIGYQYIESRYDISKQYTHTNRYLTFYDESKYVAPIVLVGAKVDFEPLSIVAQIGYSHQFRLTSIQRRLLMQDNTVVFEDFSDSVLPNHSYFIARMQIVYKANSLLNIFFNTEYQNSFSEYNYRLPITNRMNLIVSQVGLSFNIRDRQND
jgi:hypothetical protein